MLDAHAIKKDFPLFDRKINGKRIVYLDSTATTLKPRQVIDAVNTYYTQCTANVFRGIYTISEEATTAYEQARESVANLIHAKANEIVFTRNTSESLNLLAYAWLPDHAGMGDEVVSTVLEHHSNFVPWQQRAQDLGYTFRVAYLTPEGLLDLGDIAKKISKATKLFAFSAASNVLGTIPPVKEIVKLVRSVSPDCLIVVDAAQAVPHMPVDVLDWGADAIAFSSHKMLGPSGMGALWMKREHLERMRPFLYGGDMIREVHELTTLFNDVPHRFEAGTPYIEGAFGFGAAAEYLMKIGMDNVRKHEKEITGYAYTKLGAVPGVTVYGPSDMELRGGVLAFRMDGIHPHDVAQMLNEDNVCVRVGFHCAMPLHEYLKIGPTVRASFNIYNMNEDVDALVSGIQAISARFR